MTSANLTFIITNSTNNSSIEGATVSLHKYNKNTTVENGTAVFTNVAVAFRDYKYAVRMKGYTRKTGNVTVDGENGDITIGVKLVPKTKGHSFSNKPVKKATS